MATKYARAGGGNWTADATWSTTSGGAADTTKPTAADDAVLDAASGAVTIDSGAVCRSLDCNGYTGTLTLSASVGLTIGDGTAGTGNRALRLSAGMTLTIGNTFSTFSFLSTSATQQTITTAGKTVGYLTFGGTGSSYLLADALTAGTIEVNRGTFDTGNFAIAASVFDVSDTNARTLTLGSSAITLSSASTAWSAATVTNLTVTANTATVTLTGAAALFTSGTQNWNGMSVVMSGSGAQRLAGTAGYTLNNLTRTGTAVKTDGLTLSVSSVIVTGTFTATGNSATDRLLVYGFTLGTAATITAATTSLTNVDFRDITAAGAAAWTGTSIGVAPSSTTGITYTTPVTRYAVATGNVSSTGTWSATSGGASGASVPLCHDTIVLNAASGAITVTNDMPRIGEVIATGFTGTVTQSATGEVYGSITWGSGMTLNGSGQFSLYGRNNTITSAGKTFTQGVVCYGTYTLADAYANSNAGAGTTYTGLSPIASFNDGGFSMTLTGSGSSLVHNQGTLTLSGTTTIASTTATTPFQVNSGTVNHTGTIVLSGATATDRTFAGGGKTYGTLTDLNTLGGKLTVTGANTFGTINKTASVACTLALPTSSGITVTGQFNVQGTSTATLTLTGDVTKASGIVQCAYLNISSSDAAGGATFYAGRTSTDGGGNTGWLFVDLVTGTATGSGTGDGSAVGTRIVLGVAEGSGSGDGSATGTRIVLGVATGSGTGDGTATGVRTTYGTATGSGVGGGTAIGGQVDPDAGLCGYWLNPDDLRPNGCTPCNTVTAESPSDDVLNEAILAASEYLNAATQFQFPGICETTVRPCGGEEGFGFGAGLYAWSQIPFFFPSGVFPLWWAGCGCGGGCDCCGPPAFSLGKIPIVAVSEVKLDGEILEPEVDYTVVGDLLARLDPDGSGNDTWPACQNIALPDTEEGTMSVTFTWGAMPPALGTAAARDLACLLVADACGEDCKPSERMVTRQAGGTTVQLISPDGDIRTSMPRTVKLFIDAFGPPKPSMRTFPKIRRPNSGTGVIVGPLDYGIGWQRGGWGAGCAGCG